MNHYWHNDSVLLNRDYIFDGKDWIHSHLNTQNNFTRNRSIEERRTMTLEEEDRGC